VERRAHPVVSVLIPCWNSAGSIERAIESVLEEASVGLECIVVDDGSTDGSLDVIRTVAARDPRVVVLALEANAGVSAARNRGLELVRGEWLTLLDADDRFLPGGLATLVRAGLDGDAAAIIGQQVWWDGHQHSHRSRYDIDDIRRPGRKSLAANPGLLNYVSPHGKLLRRECWHGLEFRGRVLGDQPWIIRALLRAGDRIDVLGDTVYEWYRPAADVPSTSITATTRASIARGVEAIGVAVGALSEVADEAGLRLGSADAELIVARYAERLIGTDLAAHVARALDRQDAEIGRLFEAIAAFVAAAPPGSVGQSNALVRRILEPVLREWAILPNDARAAVARLLAASAKVDPALAHKAAGRLSRLALRIATVRGPDGRLALSSWLLRLAARRRLAAGAHGEPGEDEAGP
jgi:glycosyl transferase family 2